MASCFPLSLNREVKNLLDLTGRLSTQLPLMPLCTKQTYESFFLLNPSVVSSSQWTLLQTYEWAEDFPPFLRQHPSRWSHQAHSSLHGGPLLQLEALAVMDFCRLMCLRLFFLLLFSTASCSQRSVHNQRALTDKPLLGQVFGPRSNSKEKQNYCPFTMGHKLDALEVWNQGCILEGTNKNGLRVLGMYLSW